MSVDIEKLQSKVDHWRQRATVVGSLLFDTLYPDYETDDKDFKAQFVYIQEELKKVISQRDTLKDENKKLRADNGAMKALLRKELSDGKE